MLPKPEYDNFYKFVVSIGILMVGLALALPWFALELSEPIATTEAERGDRVDARRNTIGDLALDGWPWLSAGLVMGGLSVATYGLVRWKESQELLDDIRKKERDFLERQIETMTPTQIADEAAADAELEVTAPNGDAGAEAFPVPGDTKELWRSRILAVETRVLTLFQASFKWTHRARPHVRAGMRTRPISVDLLLEGRDDAYKDVLVEVKYLRGALNISSYVIDLATALGTYTALTNRPADAHLVLVIAQPSRDSYYERREADAKRRLDEALSVVDTPLTATIMREKALDVLDPADFRVLLPKGLGSTDMAGSSEEASGGPHPGG